MKYIPILFSTPMVQAILEGRKTMTRRTIKPQPHIDELGHICEGSKNYGKDFDGPAFWNYVECKSRYQKGDILWVRETWCWDYKTYPERDEKFYFYKASCPDNFLASGEKWKPSLFMPKEACRLFLKVTDVRVERLQDMTEADAIAEGIACISKDGGRTYKYGIPDADGLPGNDDCGWNWDEWEPNAIAAFKKLWFKINGEESWNANPFVWVVSFLKTERPEDFLSLKPQLHNVSEVF